MTIRQTGRQFPDRIRRVPQLRNGAQDDHNIVAKIPQGSVEGESEDFDLSHVSESSYQKGHAR